MASLLDPAHVFEAVERIERSDTPEHVLAVFHGVGETAGFSTIALGQLPPPHTNQLGGVFRSNWPDWWQQLYVEEGFVCSDPYVEYARNEVIPAVWKELDLGHEPQQWRVLDAAASHGWTNGITIPVFGPNYQGLVVIAGQSGDLSLRDRSALQLLGIAAHERIKSLLLDGVDTKLRPLPRLSEGEVECLRWLVRGKTDWEMGEILGIAQSTAHWRIERAKQKFGVKTRAQLTALAVYHGYVSP